MELWLIVMDAAMWAKIKCPQWQLQLGEQRLEQQQAPKEEETSPTSSWPARRGFAWSSVASTAFGTMRLLF
jgi:hypothetical protein